MLFYVYIIQSKVDLSYYIGYTRDLENRLLEHNIGEHKYTSKKKPWEIVYFEEFKTKTDAIKRERYLKRMKSVNVIRSLISKGP